MRTIVLFMTLFFANVYHSYAQSLENKIYLGQVITDSTTIGVEDEIGFNKHFSSIVNANNKIEIRIAKAYLPNFYIKLSYNNSWQFEKHTYDLKNKKFDTIKVNDQGKLKKLFEGLVKNNVFSIRGGNGSIEKYYLDVDKNEVFGKGIGISHPNYYCVEFKVGEMYRRYYYYEPEKMYSFLEVAEIGNFIKIVELFSKVK